MRLLALLSASLTVAVLLSGCGSSASTPPALGQLLAQSADATSHQPGAHFRLLLDGTTSATASAPSAEPTTLSIVLDGRAGRRLLDAQGQLTLNGAPTPLPFAVKLAPTLVYVQVLGQWYGEQGQSLQQALGQAGGNGAGNGTSKTNLPSLAQVEQLLRDDAERVVTAQVTSVGDAWQVQGHLNPDGVAALAKEQGHPLTAEQRRGLKRLAPGTSLSLLIGKKDHLPRSVRLQVNVSPMTAALLTPKSGAGTSPVVGATIVDLRLSLDHWGKQAAPEAPAGAKPLKALAQSLLPLLSQVGQSGLPGLGGQSSSSGSGTATIPAPAVPTTTAP